MSETHIQLDTAVIGGGIAGLWLADRLKSQGQAVALFETHALGCGQTLASQGMIHGGMKYTLSGAFTQASETIADMPNHWRACLCGEGDVDLRQTRLLSDHFFLWSTDSISSQLSGFLASKLTRGRISPVDELHYPPLLRHPDFKGHINKLEDLVLDVPSLVANLDKNLRGHCFKVNESELEWNLVDSKVSLTVRTAQHNWRIDADEFVFCAGKNNQTLLATLGLTEPQQQLRPLRQVMVKHKNPFPFFGHCLGASTTPRLTISSHWLNAKEQVWYLGGQLAEKGAQMPASSNQVAKVADDANSETDPLIIFAHQELKELVPWLDLTEAEWSCLSIERAEALQPGFARPDTATAQRAKGTSNLIVGWPTKLTLAPNLANQVCELMSAIEKHSDVSSGRASALNQLREHFDSPSVALTPWVLAFPPTVSAEERLARVFPDREAEEQAEVEAIERKGSSQSKGTSQTKGNDH